MLMPKNFCAYPLTGIGLVMFRHLRAVPKTSEMEKAVPEPHQPSA